MTTYSLPPPTGMSAAELDEIFGRHKNGADAEWQRIMSSRSDNILQPYLADFLAQNPPAVPSGNAVVANGGTVPVQNSAGAAVGNGTAVVSGNSLTAARLPATVAGVSQGGSVVVHSLADANLAGSPGVATVAAGVLSKVNLTV